VAYLTTLSVVHSTCGGGGGSSSDGSSGSGEACLRSEDAFVITCVTNLMEVKVLYVQQDQPYEISSYWRFNV
jgi:hypothetical protein